MTSDYNLLEKGLATIAVLGPVGLNQEESF
jgi:hypothetical protein